jgi:hypothetical protein
LSGKVINLVGSYFLHYAQQAGRIRHIAVVQKEPSSGLMSIVIQMIDAGGIEHGCAAAQAVHYVILAQQQLREVGAILACDACDQGAFGFSCSQTILSWVS